MRRDEAAPRARTWWLLSAAGALVGALISFLLGQDRNWDLRNYHLYNAYAWLEGRVGVDLAPAQLQSYFAPLLDVPYFWLATRVSAEAGALALGAVHGVSLGLVALIAWRLLPDARRRLRLAIMLALAGGASATFLSELGNTMGDNTTAPLLLGSLALLLPSSRGARSGTRVLVAGALLGLAVALKLTNAIHAVGLGLAVLLVPAAAGRVRDPVLLVVAALASFAVVAGPWYALVHQTFGNPLFPQFNDVFGAPLAQPVAVADAQWGPRSWWETMLWPIVFTLNPLRVGTSALPQVIWALLCVAGLAVLLRGWLRRGQVQETVPDHEFRFLLVFVLGAFGAWMLVFNIHRYLVVLELLAPLLLWKLVHPVWPRLAPVAVAGATAVSLLGWNGWGHASWRERDFVVEHAEVPRATVLFVGGEPMAWMVPFLPRGWVFASLASNFPESRAYADRVARMAAERPTFAIVPAGIDRKAQRILALDQKLRSVGLTGCSTLRWFAVRFRFKADIRDVGQGQCELVPRHNAGVTEQQEQLSIARADEALARVGRRRAGAGCRRYEARIGGDSYPYLWCPLERSHLQGGTNGSRR